MLIIHKTQGAAQARRPAFVAAFSLSPGCFPAGA
jgi:hypothetical protein